MRSLPSPSTGHPVLRNGLIFGGILAGLNLANLAIELLTGNDIATAQVVNGTTSVNLDNSGFTTLLACFLFLIALALSLVAGLLAASASGKVGTATLAGLLTGILGTCISGIVGIIFIVVLILPGLLLPPGSTLSLAQLQALVIGTAIFGLVFGVAITGGLGAGTGALGGLIGKGHHRNPEEPFYQAPLYQGWPGTMPPYPPQPFGGTPSYPPSPSPNPSEPGGGLD
jgi:hypothetical protein